MDNLAGGIYSVKSIANDFLDLTRDTKTKKVRKPFAGTRDSVNSSLDFDYTIEHEGL